MENESSQSRLRQQLDSLQNRITQFEQTLSRLQRRRLALQQIKSADISSLVRSYEATIQAQERALNGLYQLKQFAEAKLKRTS